MEKRHLKASMGANFEDWAEGYFSEESGHLNTYIARDEVFNEYQRFSNVSRITMQAFTKRLKAFCKLCPWIDCMNPPELCNAGGRIQRAVQITPELRKTKDMLYIRSVPLDTKSDAKRMLASATFLRGSLQMRRRCALAMMWLFASPTPSRSRWLHTTICRLTHARRSRSASKTLFDYSFGATSPTSTSADARCSRRSGRGARPTG